MGGWVWLLIADTMLGELNYKQVISFYPKGNWPLPHLCSHRWWGRIVWRGCSAANRSQGCWITCGNENQQWPYSSPGRNRKCSDNYERPGRICMLKTVHAKHVVFIALGFHTDLVWEQFSKLAVASQSSVVEAIPQISVRISSKTASSGRLVQM